MLLDLFLSFRAFEQLLDIFSVRLLLSDIFSKLNILGDPIGKDITESDIIIKLKAIAGQYV